MHTTNEYLICMSAIWQMNDGCAFESGRKFLDCEYSIYIYTRCIYTYECMGMWRKLSSM